MYLESLQVTNFRNLKNQKISLAPAVNFISGRNGEGKTNLLEAIYVLSLSKSFRTAKVSELAAWGEAECSVSGKVSDVVSGIELCVGLRGNTKHLYVNQNRCASVLDYLGRLTTVTFSPTDLALIKGPPVLRRRFLDKHIADLNPAFTKQLMACEKAIGSKNLLLREQNPDPRALDPWNIILAQSSEHIWKERLAFLSELQKKVNEPALRIGGQEDGAIELSLECNIPGSGLEGGWKEILAFLTSMKRKEVQQRKAQFGPHRDEVLIALGGNDTRAYASQGQTRSLVLSLKLAVVQMLEQKRNDPPVLLLDDVDSELDSERRRALFEAVFSTQRQVVITGTDASALTAPEAVPIHFMAIEKGQVGEL